MRELNTSDIAAKVAGFIGAIGLKVFSEQKDGESMLRLQVSKQFASSPKDLLQGVGAHLLVNLPGNSDEAVAAGVGLLGLGNSSQPTKS